MQKGFQNELNFKNLLDGKRVKDLSLNMQLLLKSLFKNIDNNSYIECWRSKYLEKADIKVKINGVIKGISIKSGNGCSIHQESMQQFKPFLLKIGVDDNIIELFDEYMKGYVNGVKVDAYTYIQSNKKKICIIRDTFNEYYIKINLLTRFIFQGTEIQNYDCDALIHGTPDNFQWATKNEILKYLVNYPIPLNDYLNISALNIKCYDRNLRNNPSRIKYQDYIQIKWYSLKEDLQYLTKNREAKELKEKAIKSKNTSGIVKI